MNTQNNSPEIATVEEHQPVIIERNTTVQAYSPEAEINYYIARGDVHSVVRTKEFWEKPADIQLDIMIDSVRNRERIIRGDVNELYSSGAKHKSAADAAVAEATRTHDTYINLKAYKYDGLPELMQNQRQY